MHHARCRQAGNHEESDDDSEWTEDEEVSTPVDPVDPFLAFADAVRHLQSAHPARFQVLPCCLLRSVPPPDIAAKCGRSVLQVPRWPVGGGKPHRLLSTPPCQRWLLMQVLASGRGQEQAASVQMLLQHAEKVRAQKAAEAATAQQKLPS